MNGTMDQNTTGGSSRRQRARTRIGRVGAAVALTAAVAGASSVTMASPANAAPRAAATHPASPHFAGNWGWYGYRLNRVETNQIANLSIWSAFSGVSGSSLIPYSSTLMRLYSLNWILAARNARSMGQCLAISYVGTGLIVGCP